MTEEIDISDLLDGEDELTALVPSVTDEELQDLVDPSTLRRLPDPQPRPEIEDLVKDQPPHVSLVTRHGSSLPIVPRRPVRFRHVVRQDLESHPIARATQMLSDVRASSFNGNPLDKLSTEALLQLTKTLQGLEARVSEGAEVAILLAPPDAEFRKAPLTPERLLALHLNAVPVDGVVVMKMEESLQKLRIGLRRLGLFEGRDYEVIDPNSLLAYERQVFDHLLSRQARGLRILRRLSKKLAII